MNQDRLEIIAGMIDTTDWVDLYALASPWTGFFNFALSVGGTSMSFQYFFDDKWLPFLRAGYAEDGETMLQKTVSASLGHHWGENNSLTGFGINWDQPNETTYGSGLHDQYTFELFCRLQVMRNLQITPDIQYIINPALNLEEDQNWVLGLRARLIF